MPIPTTHRPFTLEAMEPRALFSTNLYTSIGDAFDLGRSILDLEAPDGATGFGAAVVGLGDLDGDDHADFAVSAPGDLSGDQGVAPGSVYIFSGATGTLIRTLNDGAGGFGVSIANVGDLNNDGMADLLVGSPWLDSIADMVHNPAGGAYVYSGADGAVMFTLTGITQFGEFGRVVVGAGDFDDDGTRDFAVGAPAAGLLASGQVQIFSGADGAVLHTLEGTAPGERFGAAIAAALVPTDVNDAAIAVGSPHWSNSTGRVTVFGIDGAVQRVIAGTEPLELFGASVALVRKRDPFTGEVAPVLFVGAPGANDYRGQSGPAIANRGRIDQFDGSATETGQQFIGASVDDRLGEVITVVGAISDDGSEDLLVAAPGNEAAPVQYLVSYESFGWGIRTESLVGFFATSPTLHAGAFANAGDVNNDGLQDIISATTADGGRVTIISAFALGDALVVEGASPDQSYIWAYANNLNLLFVEGVATPFDRIPGLIAAPPAGDLITPFSHVRAVLNDGTIIFYDEPRSRETRSELLVLHEGVTTPLSVLVTSVVGNTAPDYDELDVAATGSAGHLALVGEDGRAWMYHDGVLTFVWNGDIADINSSGSVVGHVSNSPSLWTIADGVSALTNFETVGAINDAGHIAGTIIGTRHVNNPGQIGVQIGALLSLFGPAPDRQSESGFVVWVFRDLSEDGRVLADMSTARPRSSILDRRSYLVEGNEYCPLGEATFGLPEGDWEAFYLYQPEILNVSVMPPLSFGPDGSILAYGALLTQIEDRLPYTLREGAPVANLSLDGTQYVVGLNIYGDIVAYSEDNSGNWSGRRLWGGVHEGEYVGLAMVADPGDNDAPYAIIALGNDLLAFRLADSVFPASGPLKAFQEQTAIVSGLTVFTNTEGVVHVAGIDANGDVVIYFRSTTYLFTSPLGWTYDNLTRTHLEPQGLSTPNFVGDLTAFSTPWQGMNINGLDEHGNVHSIWWAPGQTLWTITDLSASAAADAEPLHGQITSFATEWGTLHINGINADGELTALWWAPGFAGAWHQDTLIADGVALDASSLTSFTTGWGGLNIAGRDAVTGEVVVYWWSPESQEWRDEPLALRDDAVSPALRGRLSASVSSSGIMSIAVQGAEANAYRFSWQPGDGALWSLEQLTDLVA